MASAQPLPQSEEPPPSSTADNPRASAALPFARRKWSAARCSVADGAPVSVKRKRVLARFQSAAIDASKAAPNERSDAQLRALMRFLSHVDSLAMLPEWQFMEVARAANAVMFEPGQTVRTLVFWSTGEVSQLENSGKLTQHAPHSITSGAVHGQISQHCSSIVCQA